MYKLVPFANMGTKAELEASKEGGGGGIIVALPPTSINSLSSSEVSRKAIIHSYIKSN